MSHEMYLLLTIIFFAMICVRLLVNCCLSYYKEVERKADKLALHERIVPGDGVIIDDLCPHELPPPCYEDAIRQQ